MTERAPLAGRDPQAIVRIVATDSIPEAAATILPERPLAGTVVLPSTLSRQDRLAVAVRAALRHRGVPTHLLTPAHPVAAIARPGPTWRSVGIAPPDRPATSVLLPARLVDAPARWIVTDLAGMGGRGPYALDLLARYLHPRDRIRLLASRRREDAAVDLNLGVPITRFLVSQAMPGYALVAATADPIAAELVALALAEENLSSHLGVQGVWEDRVIQRATELELGIQVPAQIELRTDRMDRFPDARAAVMRLATRIDVHFA